MKKYYVRDAKEPRNYRLSFDDDGFFKTLRRRLIQRLKEIDVKSYEWKSNLIFDLILLGWIGFACASMITPDWTLRVLLIIFSGIFATFLTNAGHNYIHKRNSWRMYGCHAVLINFREFRVLHAMVRMTREVVSRP
jgi:fatty acid desaturase